MSLTYFSYSPDEYDSIWAVALTQDLKATIAKVREVYRRNPKSLTNGGTPKSVGQGIWESAQEYLRPLTLEEITELADETNHWSILSDDRGHVSDKIRKLIEHYRKTYPNNILTEEEKKTLEMGGLDLVAKCPQCNNLHLQKQVTIRVECSAETFAITDPTKFKVLAADWERAQQSCPQCGWMKNIC
jgi:hypothetical protein